MGLPRLVTLLCFKRFKYTVHIEQLQYNTIVKKCKHKYKHKYNQLLGLPRLVTLLCYKRFKYTVVFTVQTQYKCNHKQKCNTNITNCWAFRVWSPYFAIIPLQCNIFTIPAIQTQFILCIVFV